MRIAATLLVLGLSFTLPAAAGDDYDGIRRAVQAGQVMPFKEILARAETAHPGQLVEAELEEEGGKLIYEVKLLTADGRVVELDYDARSGALLNTKEERPKR